MAGIVADFFQIVGANPVPPQNLAELIPYLLQVFVGLALVSGVFRVIGKLVDILVNFRRW